MYMYIWIRLRLGKSAAVVKGGAAPGRCMRTACERLPFIIFQAVVVVNHMNEPAHKYFVLFHVHFLAGFNISSCFYILG